MALNYITIIIQLISLIYFSYSQSTFCQNNEIWTPQIFHINNNQTFVWTKFNFSMIVDENDKLISKRIKIDGAWQPWFTNLIIHLVKEEDKVLNLGSQSGFQALAIAKIVRQKGHLYIFEPYSTSYSIMRKNMFLNNFNDFVTTYKIGASNKFFANTGSGKIENKSNNKQLKKQLLQISKAIQQQILVARVDQVIPYNIILDFALIDVQSMQIEALDGMKEVIQRSPNLIIFSEWQYGLYQQEKDYFLFEKVVKFLFQKGYKIYQIVPMDNCKIPNLIQKTTVQSLIINMDRNVLMIPKTRSLPIY